MSKLAISNWDEFSSQIMKELIKASFEQNSQALQRLLATGNATLTHTQDKGKWGTEFPRLLMEVREELRQQQSQTQPQKEIQLSTTGYKKGDPQKNPDIDYVFTENAEAYIASNSFPLEEEPDIVFPNQGKTKLNVSDVNGTNQAGIRTDNKGNISLNAYGIVVKKYQQDANGKFVAKEGQFQDTDEDFN